MVMLHILTSGDCCWNENPSQFLCTHSIPHSILDRTYQNTLDLRHRDTEKMNLCQIIEGSSRAIQNSVSVISDLRISMF